MKPGKLLAVVLFLVMLLSLWGVMWLMLNPAQPWPKYEAPELPEVLANASALAHQAGNDA